MQQAFKKTFWAISAPDNQQPILQQLKTFANSFNLFQDIYQIPYILVTLDPMQNFRFLGNLLPVEKFGWEGKKGNTNNNRGHYFCCTAGLSLDQKCCGCIQIISWFYPYSI